ncbi:MAG TPA: serine/threonine protein kinase [Gammaproteobacteria bacterium]|nr:serine/threonine protein kinase [Gammaproteobacteria bacterium]
MERDEELDSYNQLGPDAIIAAVESVGYLCDGHIFALNSYENRVYQVGVSENEPLIAKFYRPSRWTDAAILEEHRYSQELAGHEIPVVAPLENAAGETLYRYRQYRFALYPRKGGRPPELDNPDQLKQLGRFIGRIHTVGRTHLFRHRPLLGKQLAVDASSYLLGNRFIPPELQESYRTLTDDLMIRIEQCFIRAGDYANIRLHGDCHHGNILWRDNTPWILDFDDTCNGPAIQDLWMFLSGERAYMTARLSDLLEGYCEFCDFDARELHLIEALRTLRIINYAAWIARRWNDRAFPQAFPFFNTQRYWEDHILTLREQAAMMDEPPLEWHSY